MAMEYAAKLMPLLAMIFVQFVSGVLILLSKFALNSGMKPYVFVTYGQILAAVSIAPFAIYLERKTWRKITRHVLFLSLLCSIFGASLPQLVFNFGLEHSTPIISVATLNTLPAITFIIGVIFRQEKASIREWPGQAKILGTCISVGGASMLAFYHGGYLTKYQSKIHFKVAGNNIGHVHPTTAGAVLIILSRVSSAIWLIIQTRLSRMHPAPFTNATILCLFSSVQCAVISVIIADNNASAWSIKNVIQLVTVLYSGLVSSPIGLLLVSWVSGEKGPLYVSVFGPVGLILVTILSWALLDDKLYHGTLYGALLIVAGLYMVLWGKSKELHQPEVHDRAEPVEGAPGELEMPNAVTINSMNKEHEEKD